MGVRKLTALTPPPLSAAPEVGDGERAVKPPSPLAGFRQKGFRGTLTVSLFDRGEASVAQFYAHLL